MTLSGGARLGPYEIVSAIGAGGMGEVFRARDTRLNRDVAIKVLPAAFADDPERLARFTREAQTLASLNHPNIATIHGIEEVPAVGGSTGPGSRALVMELVEGEDLSTHIARGPIPIAEALPIARQIAEALEAAHEQSIVHRDLKPANIKVRPDGTVKVLDFGLAKAMDSSGPSSNPNVSHSPTLTHQGTSAGMIIGTAAYMSPEQAKGKTVDRRTDIWAFGVVLHEMLTGRRLFAAEDVSETLAAVLTRDVSITSLPANTPGRLKALVRDCLIRDSKQRLRDIGEARRVLDKIIAGAPDDAITTIAASPTTSQHAWFRTLPWALAAAVLVAFALAIPAVRHLREAPAEVRQTRFFVSPPDAWRLSVTSGPAGVSPLPVAVSPDGQRIALVMEDADRKTLLWIRSLDTLTVQALSGTDGASAPFWSPDSRFLGFFAGGKLKKIAAAGGPAVTLCDAPNSRGGAWSRDDIIVFNPSHLALQKVSSAGGVPAAATVLASDEAAHRRPFFLPDGRHFLYTASANGKDGISVYVASLDSTERKLLMNADANNVVYTQGHLLFLRETTLMAQPFDAFRLALTGEPVPIAEQIRLSGTTPPNGFFSASDDGVLAYETGVVVSGRQLTWFDRAGKVVGLVEKPGLYDNVTISPDGTRVALDFRTARASGPLAASGNTDLWVHDFAHGASARLTFDPALDRMPTWSPDGKRLAWSTNRDGLVNLYQKASSGAGAEEVLLKSSDGTSAIACDWSADGRFLLYTLLKRSPGGATTQTSELWVLPLAGNDRKPALYLQQPGFSTAQARFSPDGRFVAYTSNASGRNEVYVQPFPEAAGGKWMVSQVGGTQPRWRRDGKELFYIAADSKMMSVPVAGTPGFTPGPPKALFTALTGGGFGSSSNATRYDVTADGQKFLANVLPQEATTTPAPVTIVLNWAAGLKK